MKQYNLVIEPKLIKEVDKMIKEHGFYSSRSDFIRDAIRTRLFEIKKVILAEELEEEISEDEMSEEIKKQLLEMIKENEKGKYSGVH
jgi:Arc/MetJ-type ribon-helix-helix transcriptional regulator